MSKLDDNIARQSAALTVGRQRIHQQQRALHYGALELCKRPSTLFAASLAGATLARIGPLASAGAQQSSAEGKETSASSTMISTVRIMLFSLATTWIKREIIPL
jgi:hypothetical protein